MCILGIPLRHSDGPFHTIFVFLQSDDKTGRVAHLQETLEMY